MNQLEIKGEVFAPNHPDFDRMVLGTMFNQVDPGRRPALMVRPKHVEDIIRTVLFAREQGLRISICSGGHSWSANHLRPGSILLDMSYFDAYEIDRDQMIARAGPAIGGSVLLTKLMDQGLFFPAGHCKGVCIGGYLLQGGFAWNGRKLGMACESVLGLDIVTADGQLVHASATENPDLYWAARGAGGGFFGIVVRFHLRIYPCPRYGGMLVHGFSMKHLEHVFHWAHEVGPEVPNTVEFQLLASQRAMNLFGPGIEAVAAIFADTKEELAEAQAFMRRSPVKNKAFIRTGYWNMPISLMYRFAMSHYPEKHHWGVDNMWTHAPAESLIPHLRKIADTMPPPPTHMLWLNWHPPVRQSSMAFSVEDNIYIALYGGWKHAADTPRYGNWARDRMQEMAHLSTGIQLADEGLHKRTDRFLSDAHYQKMDGIRLQRDPGQLFHEWHSRPA
ncbi:MAG: FAD-binding oxidoreductase [Saprospiraceae bacterium]|nr:FAD-binding oxidoreductase [Saprospiraceae bacterium]